MECLDVYGMILEVFGFMNIEVMNSTIAYEMAGMEYFDTLKFGKRMEIVLHSGLLIFATVAGDMDWDRRYRKRVMSMALRELWTTTVHISYDVNEIYRRGNYD